MSVIKYTADEFCLISSIFDFYPFPSKTPK